MARSTNMVIPLLAQLEGVRKLQERIDLFNAASGGCIQLGYDSGYLDRMGGDFIEPVVFARPSSGDQHADEADPTGSASAAAISQAAGYGVNQSRYDYYSWQRDEVMRGLGSSADWSAAIAGFAADDKLVALRDNLLGSATAAIQDMDTPSANYHILDVSPGKVTAARVKITQSYINTLLNKMGDARNKIKLLVMHSAVFADLVADNITNYKVDTVAGVQLVQGVAAAQGKAIMVVDSSKLYNELTSSYYTQYYVLGLAEGALKATIVSEDEPIVDVTTTTKIKSWTWRQDYDVRYEVQGMQWVTSTINPTDTELATAGNWNEWLGDHRECGIVMGIFNAS